MVLLRPLDDLLMSSVAKGGIGGHLAVAEFVVTWLVYVKINWTASSKNPLALAVAEWIDLRVSTWTPVVGFASIQENVGWENTCVSGHARGSVPSFFIRPGFLKVHYCLFREVCNIVHRLWVPFEFSWLKNNWCWCHDVSLVGLHLATNRTESCKWVLGGLTWRSRSAWLSRGRLF